MKNINLLLNVFFYKFCTNMVQPLLDFNLHDLVVSNRYIPYRSAFNKAKQKYILIRYVIINILLISLFLILFSKVLL